MAAKKLSKPGTKTLSVVSPIQKTAFDMALDYTFANEGGFSNDKADHGGATKYGITIADLSRWRKRSVSVADVRAMLPEEAKAIYKAWYWDSLDLDNVVHTGVAIAIFDIGVVRGIGYPPKRLQQICNNHGARLTVDGHIGPKTLAALNSLPNAAFLRDFSAVVEAGFRSIVAGNYSQHVFLNGWVNRAHRLLSLINVVDVNAATPAVAAFIAMGGEKLVRAEHLENVA